VTVTRAWPRRDLVKHNFWKYVISLVLISIVLFFDSCNKYTIIWRNYTQYDSTDVVFTTQNDEKIKIVLNKTNSFFTFSSIERIIFQNPKGCGIYVYPFFNKFTESELYFYDIQILYQEENKVVVKPRKDVEAYYADFYIDELRYTVISKDNIITITEPQNFTNMVDIFSDLDNRDYTYVYTGRKDYDGAVICGYIVKSKIDNTLHWLDTH